MESVEYHILNGDCLYDRLVGAYKELIVMRECMIVGNTQGETIEEIFVQRKDFFKRKYKVSPEGYTNKVIEEISKILAIKEVSIINLWFENDLFCQANLWFTVFMLQNLEKNVDIYLVSPTVDSWLGFGAMSISELEKALRLRKKITLNDRKSISLLWKAFQVSDWQNLRGHARNLLVDIAALDKVIEAHIERFPDDKSIGRPQKSLLKIVSELKSPSFENVFKMFSKREGIYGFGDLQVRHLMEELNLP